MGGGGSAARVRRHSDFQGRHHFTPARLHLAAWGDPIVAGAPEFKNDASQSAADQALQAGMHHDGMHFFQLPRGSNSSSHGLLAVNFEYTDDGLLHNDGMENWSAEKVQKSKNAHGIGVMEIRLEGDRWMACAIRRTADASPPTRRSR